MHILHISNDFGGTEVYRNLYQHLDKMGVRQTVFVPMNPRVSNRKGNHDFIFNTAGSLIIYSHVQKWYHRYLYESKISIVLKDLKRLVDLKEISVIHTGTLCMTGAVAYEVSKMLKIPFIVSIRNTDINIYFKKMWWKRKYFNTILMSASRIVFISPQYKKDCFAFHFDKSILSGIETKCIVIPNGVDIHYLDHIVNLAKTLHKPIRVVYAGGFRNNKNLLRLIEAIDILVRKEFKIKLFAVGLLLPNRKVSDGYISLLNSAAEGKDYIELLDFKRKEELCKFYKEMDIFAMTSIHETFGLSYIEALSQGLPVIYTKKQGFDGFYNEGHVGYSVNSLDVKNIAEGIEKVIENYPKLAQNVVELGLKESFDWNEISKIYFNIYSAIIE